MPILDDLLTLGMNGLANIEPNAMDINELKKKYGRRICLVGISIFTIPLPREHRRRPRRKSRRDPGSGQRRGYILASPIALTGYLQAGKRPGHAPRPFLIRKLLKTFQA
jgi:hypothetical protein